MGRIAKLLVYPLILFVVICLFISIARDYTGHKYLSKYKESLEEKTRDVKYQDGLLRKSLGYSPSNAETFFDLGRFYADTRLIGKRRVERDRSHAMSIGYFLVGLSRKPTDGRNRAVYAWYTGSDTDHAIEHFNLAISLGPTDLYQHMMYAKWCVNQVKNNIDIKDTSFFLNKYKDEHGKTEAMKAYEDQYINGVSVSFFIKTAQVEWDKASRFWRDLAACESMADLNLLSFEIDKAITYYRKTDNRLMLARCYIIIGDPNKALDIIGWIINKSGALLWGNLADIKKQLMIISDNYPEDYRSFFWLGRFCATTRKTDAAVGYFKTAISLNPRYINTRLRLAELYSRTGRADLAIWEYERILEQAPKHKEATHLLGEALRFKYKDSGLLIMQ